MPSSLSPLAPEPCLHRSWTWGWAEEHLMQLKLSVSATNLLLQVLKTFSTSVPHKHWAHVQLRSNLSCLAAVCVPGFISCYCGTWIVNCPSSNPGVMYVSDCLMGDASDSTTTPAATAMGALTLLQELALSSSDVFTLPDSPPSSPGSGGPGSGGPGQGGPSLGGPRSGGPGPGGPDSGRERGSPASPLAAGALLGSEEQWQPEGGSKHRYATHTVCCLSCKELIYAKH